MTFEAIVDNAKHTSDMQGPRSQKLTSGELKKYEVCAFLHKFHFLCFAQVKQLTITIHRTSKAKKIVIVFLSTSFNMCFGCSKEPSHRDGSFEYHNICFG